MPRNKGDYMKYMGSKARHAKEIIPIILEGRKPGQWYVEPFVGGANVIDKIPGRRMGADINPLLIRLWNAVSNGWMPIRDISEENYKMLKTMKRGDAITAYAAFALSYGGKMWGGYRRDSIGSRNYADEAYRAAIKQFPNLVGVKFECSSYYGLTIPEGSLIYCDPPYSGTTDYSVGAFDHSKFWKWCEDKSNDGHTVFVSEYDAPEGWECVWEKTVNNTLTKNTGEKKGVEKLFRMKSET